MFEQGFQLGSTKIESPKSLESAINILTQVASHIASNTYGGVTFGNLVTGLTPYAKRSLNKYRLKAKNSTWCKNNEDEIENYAWEQLNEEAKNTAQSLEYEVQTLMTSRAETPFLTIGLDCIDLNADEETQKIQVIITKAILNQRIKGLTDGVTPVFPKIVYHLEKGNNVLPTDKYHDLYILAIKCSSLRGYPDYVMNEKTKEITGSVKPPMGLISTSPCKILLTLAQEVCSL
jgi:ribonucleoside-triphosphate reductase